MAEDPVCGMMVEKDTPYTVEYNGQIFYFCSASCAEEFEDSPELYVESVQEAFGE